MFSKIAAAMAWATLGSLAARAQVSPASPKVVELPAVAVFGRNTQTIGTLHASYIAGVRPLTPGMRCVVWLASPDSARTYGLNSLIIPLHRRFTAGRLQIQLYEKGVGSALLGEALLAAPLLINPPDSVAKRRTQLRISLQAAGLQLPPTGVFVVLDGLTTHADEAFIRYKPVKRRQKKDGTTIVKPYILTRRATDTTTVWTPAEDFPKLRQSAAGYSANTWMRWAPTWPYKREGVQSMKGRSIQAFDTVVLLELERK